MLKRNLRYTFLLLALVFTFPGRVQCRTQDVFSLLDLNLPGLEKVRESVNKGRYEEASERLLEYYKARPAVKIPGMDFDNLILEENDSLIAEDAMRHTLHVLKTPVWNYGKDIDWTYWPEKEVEIRVQLHRFPWWESMGRMYRSTGDEKYAREWVWQLRDWVKDNPYTGLAEKKSSTVSSGSLDVDSPNEMFAWRPLEVGIRLERLCTAFACFLPSKNFTPEFLVEFLTCLHQNATMLMDHFTPMGNHRIHQSYGMMRAAVFFPEIKDSKAWLEAAARNFNEESSRQLLPDGCHFELDPHYHIGFIESYVHTLEFLELNGKKDVFTPECMERIHCGAKYFLGFLYPDLTSPIFSDNRRARVPEELLSALSKLYPEDRIPTGTVGHPESGFYTFRSPSGTVMNVKATERGTWHAQPDFGTFELYTGGKVVMPDAGSYTYSGDAEVERWRAYFKATARHNTLTLDSRNYDDPHPEVLEWTPNGPHQVLKVRHQAYEGLSHTRTIEFIDESYFVITDEVEGPAAGELVLNYGFGEDVPDLDSASFTAVYREGSCGVKLEVSAPESSSIKIEKDWHSELYLVKSERYTVKIRTDRPSGSGLQRFVTVLRPFKEIIR